jgi:hypothetical protein
MEADDPTAATILAANEAFYRAFNEKDIPGMEALWASSDEIACIHPGWNLLRGREDVMESWQSILSNPGQPRIVIGGATVTLIGEIAIVLCRELVGPMPLAATNIFQLEDGAWKLLHHQSGPVSSMT